ncbi:PD-(D/E)XK nuclease family protein [Candidatus Roizmanbacteria bacterium]|nr:PD-(D/E)XK nuclease family protein [Candidatus Roizmanbacteria bacterium]
MLKISRTKVGLFLECPRCFYLDKKLGIARPGIPSFTLNNAVDTLLKKEFDLLRKNGEAHALMKKYKINAVPFKHPKLPAWRGDINRFEGAQALHRPTDILLGGIIDDIWQDTKGKLIIVDYKATSTTREISLEDKYKKGYKKQMEVYQWIFRKMGFEVSDMGYFVFANAGKNRPSFDGRLEFELSIIPHRGDSSWIEPTLYKIKECLSKETIPPYSEECEHCRFYRLIRGKETKH